ncbi:protein-lysine N-methyltransferase EEF2KMT-like [Diachasmimorpha longicaudata]|uniref:protein-lysine N-methyltransferase EEF2KMT-like n=1 Tax=Diachasmimorpha longicaudata TaxID=58733 RepID=UPI0030B8BE2B
MSDSSVITSIQRKFLACFPLSAFNLPRKIELNDQVEIFKATVGDPRVLEYPIKREYQQKFVRKIVESLENSENEEVYELFYESLCNLLSQTTDNDHKTHYRHFPLGNGGNIDRLIIQESRSLISEGTTGLCSWQAALALGEWCVLHRDFLEGKKILELGSGVGLTGLTILSLCSPRKFIFSDCHPRVLTLLRSNVDCHSRKIDHPHEIIDLPWENIDEQLSNSLDLDLVIAADVIYDKSLFPSLINGLRTLMSSGNCVGVIAMTVRNQETVSEFFEQLNSGGFVYEETDTPEFSIFIRSDDTPVRIIKLSYRNKRS